MRLRSQINLLLPLVAGALGACAADVGWSEPTIVAEGRGIRGEWRMNESQYAYVDDGTVALDDAGNVAVAWVDQARKDVLFQIFAPDGARRFAEPVNVSRTPAVFSWLPRIALGAGEPRHVFVLWQEIVFSGGSHGGEIFFARSLDGGATFEVPINLSNSVAGDGKGRTSRERWDNGSLDLALAPDGALYATWTEYEGRLWFSRSTDRGGSFSRPQLVADPAPHPARGPAVAAGREGNVYLAWTVGEDPAADIRVARSADGGERFEAPMLVHRTRTYSDAPKLAIADDGTVHLVYAESDGGPTGRFHISYTRSADGARTFTPPVEISAPLAPGVVSASFPHLAIGARGTLHVAWEAFRAVRTHPRGLGYTFSSDGGASFATPRIVPGSVPPAGGTNGSHQGLLGEKLAANADGRIALANSSLDPGEHSRVWFVRGRVE